MMGRLPCPPPCSHHAIDRWPWGQRTCCWSQSTANCSRVYAPSTCVCHPWLGRVGPRRVMPWSSRLWTSNSEHDRGRIDEMLTRRQFLINEGLLNGGRALRLMDRGCGRMDVREGGGCGRLARFADMRHGARPRRVRFVAVASLAIVGGCDPLGGRRQCAARFETHTPLGGCPRGHRLTRRPLVVALPRPAQG